MDDLVAYKHVAEELLAAEHRRGRWRAVDIRDAVGIGEIGQSEILQVLGKCLCLGAGAQQIRQQRDAGE